MSSVSPDEPEAQTCGDAFNNAWQCYCASPPPARLRSTTENICVGPDRNRTRRIPPFPFVIRSADVSDDAVLPLRRAGFVRRSMGRHLGVHGQPQTVGPGAQLQGARHRRRKGGAGQAVLEPDGPQGECCLCSPVWVFKRTCIPLTSRSETSLTYTHSYSMQQEAGARWRKQFGDKVPTENELAERDRATSSEETKSSWFF